MAILINNPGLLVGMKVFLQQIQLLEEITCMEEVELMMGILLLHVL
jgi:hypothetical protein